MVEVLSLRTPVEPMDLQVILDEDRSKAPEGTQVEVQARTNLSIGLLDIIDLTYTVPPLAIGISSPLNAEDLAMNRSTSLFTLAIPAMDKAEAEGPLLVDSTVRIANIYHATAWLEDIMADLDGKYVVAQPISMGDVWSYMVEPLRLKIDVLTAINSTTVSQNKTLVSNTDDVAPKKDAPAMLVNPNGTWSKIRFSAAVSCNYGFLWSHTINLSLNLVHTNVQSYPEVIVTETQLAFSRPWTEAIDLRLPQMEMSVFTAFVQESKGGGQGGKAAALLSDAALCSVDPRNCHLGE